MTYKMIQVGVGGYGAKWLKEFVPPAAAEGRLKTVAIADVDERALREAQAFLGLPDDRCFTDVKRAFAESGADFSLISTPPWSHEEAIRLSLDHGMDILCEKPIADTMEACARIATQVHRAGRKMALTMTHRFDQPNTTFRRELKSGACGRLDYLVFRLTGELRSYGAWGHFRHDMKDVMLIEAAIHHFDLLRDLVGADCETVYAKSWTPAWGEFAGDANVLAMMTFANGVRLTYEGASCNAVSINAYFKGYIRAECETGVLILSNGRVERHLYDSSRQRPVRREGEGETVTPVEQDKFGNVWLVDRFVRWLDGGEPMETNIDSNLKAQAIAFAAIESARTGREVNVREFLEDHLARAEQADAA